MTISKRKTTLKPTHTKRCASLLLHTRCAFSSPPLRETVSGVLLACLFFLPSHYHHFHVIIQQQHRCSLYDIYKYLLGDERLLCMADWLQYFPLGMCHINVQHVRCNVPRVCSVGCNGTWGFMDGRTELTQVSGTVTDVVPNLPKRRVPVLSFYRTLQKCPEPVPRPYRRFLKHKMHTKHKVHTVKTGKAVKALTNSSHNGNRKQVAATAK